jgi:cytochrome d ubiquinol oxidase subunit I
MIASTNLNLARIQFGSTTIYHFLFVPVSIGLAFLVAILQTMWHRSQNPDHLKLTKFFGTLLLINVAIGVVTGLVQEFEFGMNWSAYSRFVGDVFGGPLAMEGLAAFFLESTFIGLWIFGWDRLPKRIHLACIWLVAFGAMLSAAFIMAANSWMQHPVGYTLNTTTQRAELNSIVALFTNPVFLWAYAHVILAALVVGSTLMLAVSAWHLRRGSSVEAFTRSAKLSLPVLLLAMMLAMFVGGRLGVNETKYQPMKVAAMEAQWETCSPCSFSVIQVGGGKNDETPTKIIQIPHLLSVLATNTWNGQVQGLNELNAQYQQKYGQGRSYIPNVFVQYWSMRVMAYVAVVMVLFALWGALLAWRRKLEHSRLFLWCATWAIFLPFMMTTAGWLLTENGRQPWIVQGIMLTADGVSPSVSATEIWISLSAFILVYLTLLVVDLVLMLRYSRRDLTLDEAPDESEQLTGTGNGSRVPVLTY